MATMGLKADTHVDARQVDNDTKTDDTKTDDTKIDTQGPAEPRWPQIQTWGGRQVILKEVCLVVKMGSKILGG